MKQSAYLLLFTTMFLSQNTVAKDSLLTTLAKQNTQYSTIQNQTPTGLGWDKMLERAKASNSVLIGEDHFFNEIPIFVSALTKAVKFDNFFCVNLTNRTYVEWKNAENCTDIKRLGEEVVKLADLYNKLNTHRNFYPKMKISKGFIKVLKWYLIFYSSNSMFIC
jgi:hypothetical protein